MIFKIKIADKFYTGDTKKGLPVTVKNEKKAKVYTDWCKANLEAQFLTKVTHSPIKVSMRVA